MTLHPDTGAGGASGPRPFGWRWTDPNPANPARARPGSRARLVVHALEAAMVLTMFVMIEQGESLRSAARAMREAGFTGTLGAAPTAQNVRPIVTHPRHAGLVELDGLLFEPVPDPPRIVPVETFLAVQARLSDTGRRTAPERSTATLLSGIARCGRCGGPMNASNRHSGGRVPTAVYVCSRHRHLARRRDLVDPVVARAVDERLTAQSRRDPGAGAIHAAWRRALANDDLHTARHLLRATIESVEIRPIPAGTRPTDDDITITWRPNTASNYWRT